MSKAEAMSEEAVALLRDRGYLGALVKAIDTLAWALLREETGTSCGPAQRGPRAL